MATVGGAQALGLPVGLIEVGRRFDAFVIDTDGGASRGSDLHVWPDLDGPAAVFEKIVRLARPTDITSTWVNGHRAAVRPEPDAMGEQVSRDPRCDRFRVPSAKVVYANVVSDGPSRVGEWSAGCRARR